MPEAECIHTRYMDDPKTANTVHHTGHCFNMDESILPFMGICFECRFFILLSQKYKGLTREK